MSEVVHADIFFFITSIVVVLFAGAGLIASYYVVQILRDLKEITAKLNRASRELEEDFETLRREVKNEGVKMRAIVDLGLGFIASRMKKRTMPRKQKKVGEVENEPFSDNS